MKVANLADKIKIQKFSSPPAFTLIEIMVSLGILAIIFIGLIQAFPVGMMINKTAENSTKASFLAQAKIEELYALGYSNIATGAIEAKHRLSADQNNYLYYFQRETAVNFVDGNLQDSAIDTGLKKISITVYYGNALSKEEKSYNMTTLLSQW